MDQIDNILVNMVGVVRIYDSQNNRKITTALMEEHVFNRQPRYFLIEINENLLKVNIWSYSIILLCIAHETLNCPNQVIANSFHQRLVSMICGNDLILSPTGDNKLIKEESFLFRSKTVIPFSVSSKFSREDKAVFLYANEVIPKIGDEATVNGAFGSCFGLNMFGTRFAWDTNTVETYAQSMTSFAAEWQVECVRAKDNKMTYRIPPRFSKPLPELLKSMQPWAQKNPVAQWICMASSWPPHKKRKKPFTEKRWKKIWTGPLGNCPTVIAKSELFKVVVQRIVSHSDGPRTMNLDALVDDMKRRSDDPSCFRFCWSIRGADLLDYFIRIRHCCEQRDVIKMGKRMLTSNPSRDQSLRTWMIDVLASDGIHWSVAGYAMYVMKLKHVRIRTMLEFLVWLENETGPHLICSVVYGYLRYVHSNINLLMQREMIEQSRRMIFQIIQAIKLWVLRMLRPDVKDRKGLLENLNRIGVSLDVVLGQQQESSSSTNTNNAPASLSNSSASSSNSSAEPSNSSASSTNSSIASGNSSADSGNSSAGSGNALTASGNSSTASSNSSASSGNSSANPSNSSAEPSNSSASSTNSSIASGNSSTASRNSSAGSGNALTASGNLSTASRNSSAGSGNALIDSGSPSPALRKRRSTPSKQSSRSKSTKVIVIDSDSDWDVSGAQTLEQELRQNRKLKKKTTKDLGRIPKKKIRSFAPSPSGKRATRSKSESGAKARFMNVIRRSKQQLSSPSKLKKSSRTKPTPKKPTGMTPRKPAPEPTPRRNKPTPTRRKFTCRNPRFMEYAQKCLSRYDILTKIVEKDENDPERDRWMSQIMHTIERMWDCSEEQTNKFLAAYPDIYRLFNIFKKSRPVLSPEPEDNGKETRDDIKKKVGRLWNKTMTVTNRHLLKEADWIAGGEIGEYDPGVNAIAETSLARCLSCVRRLAQEDAQDTQQWLNQSEDNKQIIKAWNLLKDVKKGDLWWAWWNASKATKTVPKVQARRTKKALEKGRQ